MKHGVYQLMNCFDNKLFSTNDISAFVALFHRGSIGEQTNVTFCSVLFDVTELVLLVDMAQTGRSHVIHHKRNDVNQSEFSPIVNYARPTPSATLYQEQGPSLEK